jgi:hypothetical protein
VDQRQHDDQPHRALARRFLRRNRTQHAIAGRLEVQRQAIDALQRRRVDRIRVASVCVFE